jgi:hypothetical protein
VSAAEWPRYRRNPKISIDSAGNWPQDVGQVFGPTQGIGNVDQRAPDKGEQNSEEANLMPAKKKAKKKKKH